MKSISLEEGVPADDGRTAGAVDGPKAAIATALPPLTAAVVDRQWREFCVIEVMIRNRQVDEFVREKEREVDGLWKRIHQIADQTDPAWGLKLAKGFIAEREA